MAPKWRIESCKVPLEGRKKLVIGGRYEFENRFLALKQGLDFRKNQLKLEF